ncbi:MAG: DNA-dependent RNA polymerase subunit Rpb9 [Homavirus sp.]|uniref:DNA-dependent RNA polymerase subunit Rpb9 n=1 Tax=Homavirus sp. TaxID=2487769 RepID=A0A3G5A4X0_9VIRU|nr:MAG: DNA-dependent RNA polymerase subunit Rpb9 [Homavirus sp.]
MFDIARSIPQSGKGRGKGNDSDTHSNIHSDIHSDLYSDKHSDTHNDTHNDKHSDTHSNTHSDTHSDTHNDTHSDTHTNSQDGGDIYEDIIQKILDNLPITIKNINVDELIKSQAYKKLKIKHKEYIDNKIQDLLPLEDKKIIKNKMEKPLDELLAYFVCNNCGYATKIIPGTNIFSRKSEDISQNYAVSDYSDQLYSDIVARTRKYICPNKECESHKDNKKREAVFIRLLNTYRIKYICSACKTVI